jgi:hypothetical protein
LSNGNRTQKTTTNYNVQNFAVRDSIGVTYGTVESRSQELISTDEAECNVIVMLMLIVKITIHPSTDDSGF